jgi:hypothetical protein
VRVAAQVPEVRGELPEAPDPQVPGQAVVRGHSAIRPARSHGHSDAGTYPPYGQKLRLRASLDISGYSARNQVILKAMKRYGILYADIGGGVRWNIHGTADSRWDMDEISRLQAIVGSDLEAVDESSLMIDPDSGRARSP